MIVRTASSGTPSARVKVGSYVKRASTVLSGGTDQVTVLGGSSGWAGSVRTKLFDPPVAFIPPWQSAQPKWIGSAPLVGAVALSNNRAPSLAAALLKPRVAPV